ncbi:CoA-binding protein [Acanthopleuribacter pedis]|uniref:CoA-binding protein n=1 Tax=Acanthopleuribacter pedis TaxID=442870 RepID=A0A8J7QB51_9BACT|nr:CoA-binding protein [Acanthopleuribacter pedis]MBO1321207.1 CoA-binding protein [Acanthopleuribacter pedis]
MFGPVSEGMRLFHGKSSVAVVGYSENPARIVGKVTEFLIEEGNRVTGINPTINGTTVAKIPVKATLADLDAPVDIIQVFRNADHLPALADEILALKWRPKMVWCQQGVFDFLFQERLEHEGIQVVMDACPYALRSYL